MHELGDRGAGDAEHRPRRPNATRHPRSDGRPSGRRPGRAGRPPLQARVVGDHPGRGQVDDDLGGQAVIVGAHFGGDPPGRLLGAPTSSSPKHAPTCVAQTATGLRIDPRRVRVDIGRGLTGRDLHVCIRVVDLLLFLVLDSETLAALHATVSHSPIPYGDEGSSGASWRPSTSTSQRRPGARDRRRSEVTRVAPSCSARAT